MGTLGDDIFGRTLPGQGAMRHERGSMVGDNVDQGVNDSWLLFNARKGSIPPMVQFLDVRALVEWTPSLRKQP